MHGDQAERGAKAGSGDLSATSLSPSSTWDVSEQTGDFSTSYPLRVPPAPGGLLPSLALSYRSSAVDGRTSTTNNQPSWIGDGWDLSPGFVERSYGGCADDTEGTEPPKTGDLCWRSDNATASYSGGGGMLVKDDGPNGWHPKQDDGSRIDRVYDANLRNGAHDGEYWRITTIDGTQYFFGSEVDSKSTWTVPVFGDDAGEPCHTATFETSRCDQAWRWNLDKVIDRNGNEIRYFYEPETNAYGANLHDTAVSYIRGGNLIRVEYGLNVGVTAPATGMVSFALADRCIPGSNCARTNKGNWPDTPLDNDCTGSSCTQHSPSFWSTNRLASVTTQVRKGSGYSNVDRWDLDQQYPDPGSGEKPALWLKGIKHTGLAGEPLGLPSATFEGTPYPNRVVRLDGVSSLNRFRLTGIVSETGGVTSVNYRTPECKDGGPMPASPETNTLLCFPVRWTRPGEQERTDYFHKYVVEQVVVTDWASTSTQQVTSYEYLDGAAWHWSMSEFAKDEKKTWDEFRGFGRVRVRTGAPGPADPAGPMTMSEQWFYRGMNGDRLNRAGGTKLVNLSDSEGGTPRHDEDWLAGIVFEAKWFEHEAASDRPDPPLVGKTITDPTWRGPTAARGPFKAYLVNDGTQRGFTALASGGWRKTRTQTDYDEFGLPIKVNDLGDLTGSDDDRCTTTTYRRDTGRWLMNLAAAVETVAVACGMTPTFPRDAIAAARNSYDDKGNLTKTAVAKDRPAADPAYVTTGTAVFDGYGRVVESTNANGKTTKISFVPATGGPVTSTTTTTPAPPTLPGGLATTTTLDPAFGVPTLITDPNGRQTVFAYDALGRKTKVWLANRDPETDDPSAWISYLIRNDATTVVTVSQLGPNGYYVTGNTIYDGQLRPRQKQTPAAGGGRLIVDTRYDSQGRAYKQTQPYFNDKPVDTQLWVASDTEVPGLVRTRFDGAGRPAVSVYQAGAIERWRTTTEYSGDRVSVTPPAGGTATTRITDARGQLTELRQYLSGSPQGTSESTRYKYSPAGNLVEVTAPGGATWRYGYDLRGRKISSDDPDSGAATMSYDDLNQLVSTKDARSTVLAYDYDDLGRPTAVRGGSATGSKLAEYTYDSVPKGKGRPASATSFVDGNAYTTSIGAYSPLYQPTTTSVTIPSVAGLGLLAGTYTSAMGYGPDGSLSGITYPEAGGLPRESVNYVLDDFARPVSSSGGLAGTMELVTDAKYTRYGEPERVQFGTGTKRTWLSYYYDTDTRRLNRSIVDAEAPKPMQSDVHYTYDPAGNVTSVADTVIDQVADTQCFRYDHVQRLTEAWTPAGDCAPNPGTAALGGPAPYWRSYSYDLNGNRSTETVHTSTVNTVRGYTYPDPAGPQPHTVRSVSTNGTATESYGYDAAGHTTSRTKPGVAQTLSWDTQGKLASTSQPGQTDTSFVYGPTGERLLRKDPTGTTLYLGNQEVRLAASGGSPVATRFYSFGGTTIAVRQGSKLTWLAGDHQGTAQLTVDASTMAVNRRRQLPFGGPRGAGPTFWPDDHGFVGGVQDASTGLTHLGAREYDPDLGRFVSVDPIQDLTDPQQWNGYAYANNSPITFSDASGQYLVGGEDDHGNQYGVSYMGGTTTVIGSADAVNGVGTSGGGHHSTKPAGSPIKKSSRGYRNDPNYREPRPDIVECGGPLTPGYYVYAGCIDISRSRRCDFDDVIKGKNCKIGETAYDTIRRHDHESSLANNQKNEEEKKSSRSYPEVLLGEVSELFSKPIQSVSVCVTGAAGTVSHAEAEVCVTGDDYGLTLNGSLKLSRQLGGGTSYGGAVKFQTERADQVNSSFTPSVAGGLEIVDAIGGGAEVETDSQNNLTVSGNVSAGFRETFGPKSYLAGFTANLGYVVNWKQILSLFN